MRVIINADDFGYSHDVNTAIEEAIIAGKISSSTIMANGPAFNDAVQIAKKYGHISFGVHLNIIEFAPLSDKRVFEKYGLLDSMGNFKQGSIFSITTFQDELKKAIKQEWGSQIRKLIEAGVTISHIDSHQHTHSISALQQVLLELMDEYGIQKCRRRMYVGFFRLLRIRGYSQPVYENTSITKPVRKKVVTKLFNHLFVLPYRQKQWLRKMNNHAIVTDELMIYQLFAQDLSRFANCYKSKVVEVECHPGLLSNADETQMVMHDAIRQYVPTYRLISYSDL